jgi:glyoxylase-like metal-dependent hydrolase (beta-lactamase superfamily II)
VPRLTGPFPGLAYGEATEVAPGVRRVTAGNPGPFTGAGTNSYILGKGQVAVIDPGPPMAAHVAALLNAVAGETVTHILLTHSHDDHSGAAPLLRAATGAVLLSGGPHRPSRPPRPNEKESAEGADLAHRPDQILADGERIAGGSWQVEAIATPGHTANHFAFTLAGGDLIFTGDHVMGWSSTIVAPPDGSMADYMASLDRLGTRPEHRLLPGHGPPVADAAGRIADVRRHRRAREAAILARLHAGDRSIPAIVAAVYQDVDRSLHDAAALTVLAHLEDLVDRGLARLEAGVRLGGRYCAAGSTLP